MAIKIKLPKKMQGEDLAKIIEDSMNFLEDYKVARGVEGHYEPGSVRRVETGYHLNAYKYKREYTNAFKGWGKIFYLLPVFGWSLWIADKTCTRSKSTKIEVSLDSAEQYEELDFEVIYNYFGNEEITLRNLDQREEVKEDFEKLVEEIYSRIK